MPDSIVSIDHQIVNFNMVDNSMVNLTIYKDTVFLLEYTKTGMVIDFSKIQRRVCRQARSVFPGFSPKSIIR